MKPNEIAQAAREKIAGNPALEADMRAAWPAIEDAIAQLVHTSNFAHPNYMFQKLHRAARLEMLTSFVAGKTPKECAADAMRVVVPD